MLNKNPDTQVDIDSADCVAVIGTGNFGKAIANKLVKAGIQVVIGSRNPAGLSVSIERAFQEKIVILAVPVFSWPDLPLSKIEPGTVLIDCSNQTSKCPLDQLSQAEQLQEMVGPKVQVVKGLNTISAYELENQTSSAGKQVPIAGNCPTKKQVVGVLLEKLDYSVSDMGDLDQARLIENIPLALFPEWKKPFLISLAIWMFLYLLTFARYHFCQDNQFGLSGEGLENMFLKYINKACDAHALVLLAACYLPGVLAAYIQLGLGTKYSQFPTWLDNWMKMRKQLGIFMLFSASIHGFIYFLHWNTEYKEVKVPTPSEESWDWSNLFTVTGWNELVDWGYKTNIMLGSGIIAYFLAVVLGITSLPSVASSLSWKEFRLLQSWLGWVCLLLASVHCGVNGLHKLLRVKNCIFFDTEQQALVLPAITIALKIPLLLPWVDSRLTQIRQGKEF